MGVRGQQQVAPQSLQVRMRHDALHQAFGQALTAMAFQHKDIGDESEGRFIRDDAGEAGQRLSLVETEAERVLDGTLHDIARNAARLVAVFVQKAMDGIKVEPRGIG